MILQHLDTDESVDYDKSFLTSTMTSGDMKYHGPFEVRLLCSVKPINAQKSLVEQLYKQCMYVCLSDWPSYASHFSRQHITEFSFRFREISENIHYVERNKISFFWKHWPNCGPVLWRAKHHYLEYWSLYCIHWLSESLNNRNAIALIMTPQ